MAVDPADLEPTDLWAALERQAGLTPDKAAFRILDSAGAAQEVLTFRDLHRRAEATAGKLAARGLAGKRTFLFHPTGVDFIVSFFAVLRAGGAVVPANPRLLVSADYGLSGLLERAAPAVLLGDKTAAARLARTGAAGPGAMVEVVPTDGEAERTAARACLGPEDIAVIQYTSGSTSAPKGVAITHANLLANARLLHATFDGQPDDVAISWLPLFHDMGLMVGLIWPVVMGGTGVLMRPSSFAARPKAWLEALSTWGGTITAGPNFAYQLCVDRVEDIGNLDLGAVRVAICGAEPVRPETVQGFQDRFAPTRLDPRALIPAYGLAEATVFVSGGRGGLKTIPDGSTRRVSCGKPADGYDLRIVDPDTRTVLPEGVAGEVWLRGPSVAAGYFGDPGATAETFGALLADGEGPFLRTGDRGVLMDGDLFITGRYKDLIIIHGANHAPQDIELTCAAVAPELGHCAAFTVEAGGEDRLVIMAEVGSENRNNFAILATNVKDEIAARHGLALHALTLVRPKSLPLTGSGKVRRRPTREAWLAGALDPVAEWRETDSKDPPPMTAAAPEEPIPDLLAELARRGVAAWLEGGEVRLRGPLSRCADQLAALKARKPEVIAHLAQASPAPPAEGPIITSAPDAAFAAVPAGGFAALVEADRYDDASAAFGRMIAATEDHYWDPRSSAYLDLDAPFDVTAQPMISEEAFPCLRAPSVAARLADSADRTRFINRVVWLRFSNLLHGEQGALNLAASLCGVLKDQGAQEFAANQVREEARHVAAFTRYIKARWGRPAPCMPALKSFLSEIIEADDVSKKIIGMQIMVEGLAMGTLGSLYKTLLDPAGKRLVQLVMTDEAFHHKFGKLWADKTMPHISAADRTRLETWTDHCLESFIVKMNPPLELQVLNREFGLDPMVVSRELAEIDGGPLSSLGAREIFRVLSNTMKGAGLLSPRSLQAYEAFLDDDGDLSSLGYDEIVEDGLEYLRGINHPAH